MQASQKSPSPIRVESPDTHKILRFPTTPKERLQLQLAKLKARNIQIIGE